MLLPGTGSVAHGTIADDDAGPGAPTGLTATARGASVELTWTAPSNRGTLNGATATITGYAYRISTSPDLLVIATLPLTATDSTNTTHTVQVGAAGTYYFVVQALNGVTDSNGNPTGHASTTASATVTIGATIVATAPDPLTERELDGARLTVDLTGTTYVSSLSPSQFSLTPSTSGLSVASVSRRDADMAVLTLAFDGNFGSDLGLRVTVDAAAINVNADLTTDAVTVTQAPPPDRVQNVRLTPGPGSLDVMWNEAANADGYYVTAEEAGTGQIHQVQAAGGSTTRTTVTGLKGETRYNVNIYAYSNFARHGGFLISHVSATTLPAHAIVSATDPSPLTEDGLDGAKVTVEFLGNPYAAWWRDLLVSQFTASGVPGVSVSAVERLSDRQARLTLAYDDTDFDTDATLLIRIDGLAFNSGSDISAVTGVRAVVEPPPARVQNLRLTTPGTQQVHVQWNPVPSAIENPDVNVYKVQWKGPGEGWHESRQHDVRGSRTYDIIRGLRPGAEYAVRVIATKHKAPDGPPSAEARATTPEFRYRLAGTEPAELTGANLNGAALIVELEGATWEPLGQRVRKPEPHFKLSGIDRVRVDRVERVSPSRLKVVLAHRGPPVMQDGDLTLTIQADTHTWNEQIVVTAPVKAPRDRPAACASLEVGESTATVSWDRVEGNDILYLVRWKESASSGGWRQRGMKGWSRPGSTPSYTIRDLRPSTEYTVQWRYYDRGGAGLSKWSTAEMTTTPAATSPVLSVAPPRVSEGDSGTTTQMTFTFTLSKAGTETVEADLRIGSSGSTATPDDDYTVEDGQQLLTFAPGETEKTLTVTVTGDDAVEPDETVVIDVGWLEHAFFGSGFDGAAGARWRSVTGTIVNDELPVLSVSSPRVTEGGAGTTTPMVFELTLTPASDKTVSFDLAVGVSVQDQTASVTSDYVVNTAGLSPLLTFSPGETRKTINALSVNGDTEVEPDETVGLVIRPTNPANVVFASDLDTTIFPGRAVAFGTIVDDDTTSPAMRGSVTVAAADPLSVAEGGSATYTVVLDGEPAGDVAIAIASDNADVTVRAGEPHLHRRTTGRRRRPSPSARPRTGTRRMTPPPSATR